ncbi:MAG: triple tyrosine motif-containing protein [Dysgonomonas sp.]|nr:triple tyrosine motif-containing protein [Dysgonomonas sp.]
MKIYHFAFLYFILLCLPIFNAQANNPYIVNFGKDVYKAANKNWSIDQDNEGYTYFGNDSGLLQFNGVEWSLFQTQYKSVIRAVAVLNHKTIFTAGYEELGIWNRDISGKLKYTSLKPLIDQKSIQENDFWKIWIYEDKIYFQSFNSIFVYDHENVTEIKTNHNILFLLNVNNQFWVQEMQGKLLQLEGDKLIEPAGGDIFIGKDVRTILPYQSNKLLICTATDGLFIYDGTSFTKWENPISSALKLNELNCGLYTSRGTYFFGTILNGIYEANMNGEILNHFSTTSMLNNNTILSLYEDKNGNFWAGLDRGIAYIQYLNNMDYYTDPSGNIGAVYDAIYWKDKFYIGTNQGLFYLPKDKMTSSTSLTNLEFVNGTQGQVWALRIIDGKLICCHNRGALSIENNYSQPYLPSIRSGVYDIKESIINKKEVLILSTYNHLKVVKKGTNVIYNIHEEEGPVIKSEYDHLGNIWAEHPYKGAYRYLLNDDLTGIKNRDYYGEEYQEILSHKLSIFKVGGRIILFGDNKFFTYDETDNTIKPNEKLNECFSSVSNLKKVIHIKGNLFWGIANNSIFKFHYDGYNSEIIERYDVGIHKLSLVEGYENISVLNDSVSLIFLDNGFLLYNDQRVKVEANMPLGKPHLESIQTKAINGNYEYRDPNDSPKIPYNYNSVIFRFTTANILSHNLSLQYKLEGVDSGWSIFQKINQVSYERLPKGNYTFMVRTVNNLGNYSEPIAYEFEIRAPWYQTVWAYLVYILIFFSLLYASWIFMLRKYRNLHLQKIRYRETKRLRNLTRTLQCEIEQKSAELLTQTSFIIQKNELILKIKDIVNDVYSKNKNSAITTLYQRINALLNNNMNSEDDWKMFLIKFEEKHTGFFQKMKILYPELTNSDLRLCACLRLNLETKEIASLMNLSIRTVENNRYRLRKKLNLPPTENLNEFFLRINM